MIKHITGPLSIRWVPAPPGTPEPGAVPEPTTVVHALLEAAVAAALLLPLDRRALRAALLALLDALAAPAERMAANCGAVAHRLAYASAWEHLPEPEAHVVALMATWLGLAYEWPVETAALGALPEQLRDQVRALAAREAAN